MSQVTNAADRNQAFIKFLLFFIATLILVVLAVYFDYRLPVKENNMLREEIAIQQQTDFNQGKFVEELQTISIYLDSLDKPGTNKEQINLLLDPKISDLNALQLKDNSTNGKLDRIIVQNISAHFIDKKKIADMNVKVASIGELESDLKAAQEQLQSANLSLDNYRRQR